MVTGFDEARLFAVKINNQAIPLIIEIRKIQVQIFLRL